MLSLQELKSSKKKELIKELHQASLKLQELRIGVKTSHLKDTSLIGKQKRYVAQIQTCLTETNLDEMVEKANQFTAS